MFLDEDPPEFDDHSTELHVCLFPAEEEGVRMVEVECPVYLQMGLFSMGTGRGGRFVRAKMSSTGIHFKVTILAVFVSSVLTCLCGAAFNGPR